MPRVGLDIGNPTSVFLLTSCKLEEDGMMFRLQEQFNLDPNENIIIEGTPNDLTYLITLLWCMQNGSIGFENEEDGNCKMVYMADFLFQKG